MKSGRAFGFKLVKLDLNCKVNKSSATWSGDLNVLPNKPPVMEITSLQTSHHVTRFSPKFGWTNMMLVS